MSGTVTVVPSDGTTARRPGDQLEVEASWRLPEPPASLEARLIWFTRGKGTQDVGVVESKPIGEPRAKGQERIRFKLPDSPYSFSGQLVSLIWAVEVVASGGEVGRWEFVLAPDGREILLEQPKHAPRVR